MKKFTSILFAGVLAVCALSSCVEEKKGYVIDGLVTDVTEGVMYLKKYENKGFVHVDSAIIQDGYFKFEGIVPEALAHGLTTMKESTRPLVFFLDNVTMTIKMNESNKELSVSGSPSNDVYLKYAKNVRNKDFDLDNLITSYPSSPVVAYFVVKDFAYKFSLQEMKDVRAKFDTSLNGSTYIQQIESMISRMEKVQVGSVAPDFVLPDVEGNLVSLSSYRGKYLLVDFWAAWCPDCRKENPNIIDAWRKYKNKNFAILGVSLDRKKEQWLAAIEKDKLTWTQVSDLKSWNSEVAMLYCIRWIPTSFLIDPKGKIIAVGLEGEALHDKLNELLN